MTLHFPPVTPMLRTVLWVLGSCFAVQVFAEKVFELQGAVAWLSLSAPGLTERFALWQLVSYALLHGDLWHLLMNMLGLYMFGGDVERVLGSRGFLKYLLVCVIGGGVAYTVTALISGSRVPVVGASAGVLGVLVGFAVFFPDRQLMVFPLPMPIRARTVALIYGAIDLYNAIAANSQHAGATGGRTVAFTAHLGGMLIGFVYLQWFVRGGGSRWRLPFRRNRAFRVIQGRRDDPFNLH